GGDDQHVHRLRPVGAARRRRGDRLRAAGTRPQRVRARRESRDGRQGRQWRQVDGAQRVGGNDWRRGRSQPEGFHRHARAGGPDADGARVENDWSGELVSAVCGGARRSAACGEDCNGCNGDDESGYHGYSLAAFTPLPDDGPQMRRNVTVWPAPTLTMLMHLPAYI